MTLSETLLPKLNDWRPAGAGRHVLAATDETTGWTVTVSADRVETTGCLLWEVALKRKSVPAAPDIQAWADRTAQRISGLVETLKVIEVDARRGEALLRSAEPTRRNDQLFYYELHLKNTGEALVRRFQANHLPAQPRQQVAFALTHEVLAKLAEDVTVAA